MIVARAFVTGLLVALALAAPLRAVSQEVHGVVADELTGRGIPRAEVSGRSPSGALLATVTTDAVGRFVLRLPAGGRVLLSAQRAGYVRLDDVPEEASSLAPVSVILRLEPESPPPRGDPVEPSPASDGRGGGGPDLVAAWLYARVGTSDNRSFVSPQGLGAGAHVRLKEHVGLRVDVGRTDARVDRTGRTCHRIQPIDRSCTNEAIMGSTSLTSVEVAMTLSFDVAGPVGVGLGIGPVVGVIGSDSRGVSGRAADVALPKTAHLGLAGLAELRVAPEAFPLFLTAGIRFQRVHIDGCLGDPPFTEEPFCGPLQVRWGQLELGWRR